MGGVWFDGRWGHAEIPVDIASCSSDVRDQELVHVVHERLNPRELTIHDSLPLTVSERSVCFEMRHALSLREAVVAADMAFFSDLTSWYELLQYFATRTGSTGIPQAREALLLACESSWSPPETRLRLVWELDASLPRPLANHPVFDERGHHVATPDLLDPWSGLAVEYDGLIHFGREQRAHDVGRESRMRDVGLDCLTVLGPDLRKPQRLAARLRHARERALRTRRPRAWTTEYPAWWTPTDTVEQRRRLRSSPAASA